MEISAQDIKKLREITGAGIMDCKQALNEANGDFEKAIEWLRQKGLSALAKRAEREAKEGLIDAYIHFQGRVGVLIEVNCETDFVARNEEFKKFVHDLAMQVAAQAPLYVSREDVPDELIEKERQIYFEQMKDENKPDHIKEKIVEGKMEKFYEQVCLLDQSFIKNPDIKIKDYLGEMAAKLGENIVIRRFVRFELGEHS
ncbi:MAG: translation elongation factor Ts [Actinobacteria bacterium]|nr:translation elongation factor Ts [Actinomycetota bacterium]